MPPPSLAQCHDLAAVRASLQPAGTWRRFPAANDRTAWEKNPIAERRQLIATGEARAAEDWEHLTATLILDFKRKGDRRSYQDPHFRRRTRLHDLVLAECAEGRGRFMDAIADNVWLTCEETFWGWPAHLDEQQAGRELPDIAEPIVDLGVGESAALLAWTDHLLGPQLDSVSPLLRRRIRHEVDRRVLTPCLERDNFWWMGWLRRHHPVNNWNPWVNSNWLACVLVLEEDADRRARAVHKIMRSLDVFLTHQSTDGGCDEGPGYWSRAAASLFDALELLHHATSGRVSLFHEPLIAEMGRFIQRAHVTGDWFINFADAGAKVQVEGALLQRYGRLVGDDSLVDFGRWIEQAQAGRPLPRIRSINRTLGELLDRGPEAAAVIKEPPLLRDVWLPDLQVMAARDAAGSAGGFFVAAKGGHNAESHNHNDLGSFLVYLDGEPLLIDVGVETYTAKTFSPQRYEIWTMQSQWHNLPTINGVMQAAGREFAAREVAYAADDAAATLSLDLAAAYPPAAAVTRWMRTVCLQRGRAIELTDEFALERTEAPLLFNFITAQKPILEPGAVVLRTAGGHTARLSFDAVSFTTQAEIREITDPQLEKVWGDRVYRVQLHAKTAVLSARHEFRLTR